MKGRKSFGGVIALVLAIIILIGGLAYLVVRQVQADLPEKEEPETQVESASITDNYLVQAETNSAVELFNLIE